MQKNIQLQQLGIYRKSYVSSCNQVALFWLQYLTASHSFSYKKIWLMPEETYQREAV